MTGPRAVRIKSEGQAWKIIGVIIKMDNASRELN